MNKNAVYLFLLTAIVGCAAADSSGRFVVLSDIHAYGCGDDADASDGGPCSVTRPATCPGPNAPSGLSCNAHLNDTDKCLFDSLLLDIACTQSGKTDFVIYSGDWIAHSYQEPGKSNEKKQIIATQSSSLHQQFGTGTLIIPALGNNDAYQGDYNVQPCLKMSLSDCQDASGNYKPDEGEFLSDTLAAWKPLLANAKELGTACGARGLDESFMRGGYYALSNPHLPENCTLVLNTVLLGKNFISGVPEGSHWGWWLKGNGFDAAAMQLNWLKARLEFASKNNRKVWLIYHVPPGADAYGSHSSGTASMMYLSQSWPGTLTPKPPGSGPADGFLKLMADHHPVIEAAFGGHTHMDSFRVLYSNGAPISWVHITPSVSPQHHGSESAYQQFDYKVAGNSTVLVDYTTRRLDLTTAGSAWKDEYSWKKQFCSPSCKYDDVSLSGVYQALSSPRHPGDDSLKDRYTRYYGEGSCTGIGDSGYWKYYVCAIGELSESGYQSCFQAR